jgi:hypothetical protein
MRSGYLSRLSGAALAVLAVASCGPGQHNAPTNQSLSYDSREPGSDASPTNDESFQLLSADGPARFATLQTLIVQAGKHCASVTKGVLEGGLDGTDEWRVNCADTGAWQLWFNADGGTAVDHCANAKCA